MKKQFFRNSRSKYRKSNLGTVTFHMVLGRWLGTATLIHTNSTCSFNRIYTKQNSHYVLERTKPIPSGKAAGMRLPVPSSPCLQGGSTEEMQAPPACCSSQHPHSCSAALSVLCDSNGQKSESFFCPLQATFTATLPLQFRELGLEISDKY